MKKMIVLMAIFITISSFAEEAKQLQEMNLTAAECIAFEDSRNGILSSQGAKLATIITINGYTAEDDFSGAAIVLDQMGEPDAPFTVLQGDAGDSTCLDMALVRRLHAAQFAG